MKKIFVFIVALSLSASAFAQLELGVDGGFSTTWLLNNNVSDQGPNLNPNASFGGSGGIAGSFYFNHKIGVGAEINLNSVNQKYDGTTNSVNYDGKDHVKYIQIPILLKVKTESGFYFEFGPEWNFLSSAHGDLTSDPANALVDYSDRDIKSGFESSVVGIVFGFGGAFPITDNIGLTAGLRFFGALSDATVEYSETEFYEHLLGAEDLGIADSYAHMDQQGNYHYEKTTLVTGGIQLGLLYAIGKTTK